MPSCNCLALLLLLACLPLTGRAANLHDQIDTLIETKGSGKPVSPLSGDSEFLRRVSLDLSGTIPTSSQARAFLADKAPDKRARLIDRLLASPEHPRHMQEMFHILLMERLGDHPEWTNYLRRSFEANKPFDQMVREILRADPADKSSQGAAYFLARRLESYGANPVDRPGLARDVGRLFLGKDLRCAQCHDHLFISDYTQADFQGLLAFFEPVSLHDASAPSLSEKVVDKKLPFMSVFKKVPRQTGPRLPGGKEVALPALEKGKEYLVAPDPRKRLAGVPRFSLLAELSRQVGSADNHDFGRNIVNRMWFVMLGRGLVHPLDLHHSDNQPSHPELLALLEKEFAAHKFDLRWLLRELALTRTYQRSSLLPAGAASSDPALFLTMSEKRLSGEQLFWATLEACGERERLLQADRTAREAAPRGKGKKQPGPLDAAQLKFVRAFANPPREPEEEVSPSLKSALFLLNDSLVLGWLAPHPGNLLGRLEGQADAGLLAEELYLSVLTRLPTAEEKAEVARHLARPGKKRVERLFELTWALLTSTEFTVNH